jgi:hypothetical protein
MSWSSALQKKRRGMKTRMVLADPLRIASGVAGLISLVFDVAQSVS